MVAWSPDGISDVGSVGGDYSKRFAAGMTILEGPIYLQ